MVKWAIEADKRGIFRAIIVPPVGDIRFEGGFVTRESAEIWIKDEFWRMGIKEIPPEAA